MRLPIRPEKMVKDRTNGIIQPIAETYQSESCKLIDDFVARSFNKLHAPTCTVSISCARHMLDPY